MPSTQEIRSAFLTFFEQNDHVIMPSSPLVPHNDPSLLFTNAGMVQFKNIFTGTEKASASRAATSQKCVRAGGKHNDLDNVGYTARHHTFFEMLGNFSFGDYFKERAIYLAWELVHKEFSLPTDRLLVTVYHTDDHAFRLWKTISGLPEDRIIRIETEGHEKYALYQWTKDTIENPEKKLKYLKSFTIYVLDEQIYSGDVADALEQDLRSLGDSDFILGISKYDTNPANNPQMPAKYRA